MESCVKGNNTRAVPANKSTKITECTCGSECCVLITKPHKTICGFAKLSDTEKQRLYRFADEYVRQRAIADGFVPHGKESGICVRCYHASQDQAILHSKHDSTSQANGCATMIEGSNITNLFKRDAEREQHKSDTHHHPQRRCESLVAVAAMDHLAGAVVVDTTGVLLPIPLQSTIAVPGGKHLRLTGGA